MKKLLALLMVVCLCMFVVACGEKPVETPPPTDTTAPDDTPTDDTTTDDTSADSAAGLTELPDLTASPEDTLTEPEDDLGNIDPLKPVE